MYCPWAVVTGEFDVAALPGLRYSRIHPRRQYLISSALRPESSLMWEGRSRGCSSRRSPAPWPYAYAVGRYGEDGGLSTAATLRACNSPCISSVYWGDEVEDEDEDGTTSKMDEAQMPVDSLRGDLDRCSVLGVRCSVWNGRPDVCMYTYASIRCVYCIRIRMRIRLASQPPEALPGDWICTVHDGASANEWREGGLEWRGKTPELLSGERRLLPEPDGTLRLRLEASRGASRRAERHGRGQTDVVTYDALHSGRRAKDVVRWQLALQTNSECSGGPPPPDAAGSHRREGCVHLASKMGSWVEMEQAIGWMLAHRQQLAVAGRALRASSIPTSASVRGETCRRCCERPR